MEVSYIFKVPNSGMKGENMSKNNVASERKRLGMSQKDLAETLGVSRDSVKKWEAGESIKLSFLLDMANLFRCSLDYLLGRSDDRILHEPSEI